MDGTKIGATIKALRESKGLSLQEVADILGNNRSTISRWENGHTEKIKKEQIKMLAVIFKVDESVFFDTTNDCIDLKNDTSPFNDFLYEKKSVSPSHYRDDYPWLYDEKSSFFSLTIRGDSMNRLRLFDGDTVLIRKQSHVENGEVAVVMVNGDETTIKTFYKNGDTVMLVPNSTNPRHQVKVYNLKDTEIRILGKAEKVYFNL